MTYKFVKRFKQVVRMWQVDHNILRDTGGESFKNASAWKNNSKPRLIITHLKIDKYRRDQRIDYAGVYQWSGVVRITNTV